MTILINLSLALPMAFCLDLSLMADFIVFEGPEKATRGRGGGGGEWEIIKIPRGNMAYITKSTNTPLF
jgi:hypothetical protein